MFLFELGHRYSFLRLYVLALMLIAYPLESAQGEVLTRPEAIQLALEHNPAVLAAKKEWEAAQARARQEGALPNPELELELEELPEIGDFDGFGERNMGVSQRFESPLKWWNRRKSGRQQADAVRLSEFETTKLEIIEQASNAYDRIVLQQSILRDTRQSLALARDFLRKAQIRFNAGDVPQLEVMLAEVEVGRATNELTEAANALKVATIKLNTVLAYADSSPIVAEDSLRYRRLEVDLQLLKERALADRPELLAATQQAAALRSRHSAAKAALMPDLNVGAFRQRIRGNGEEENFWRVNFALEFPLWAFSRERGEIAEARAEVGQAFAKHLALRHQILLETETAYLDVETAQKQVALFQQQILPTIERTYQIANHSYDEGKATYLELLEVQRALVETRIDHAEALFNYRVAIVALERAVAGPLFDD